MMDLISRQAAIDVLDKNYILGHCTYYGGGGDWGLFCSHNDMYHHLGKFSDEPCRYYARKES